MIEATLLGPWTEVEVGGGDAGYAPRVALDYPAAGYRDLTDQPAPNVPPAPNVFVQRLRCSDDVYAQIEADETYTVLTSEEV